MKKMIPLYQSLISSGENFEVECTNNFYKIIHDGVAFKFFAGSRPNFSTFNISRKLKKEVIERDYIPVQNYNIEEYFKCNQDFDFDITGDFYCVDIKQAYITILKNKGLISNEIFKDVCAMKKSDRLKVLGMLARRKTKYTYYGGRMIESETDRLPTEKYFFWCVEQTYLLMSDIAKKIGRGFIFFWVDCIFFVGRENINYVMDRLKSERLMFTMERMRVMGISESKAYYTFSFLKSSKLKEYNVPKIKKTELLSKAKHCFVTEDFKGFKYYFNEYENVRSDIS